MTVHCKSGQDFVVKARIGGYLSQRAAAGSKVCKRKPGENNVRIVRMRIIQFVFHLVSALALITAIVAGVLDSIQSVSASSVMLTSLGNAWLNLDPESLTLAEIYAETYISGDIWRPFVAPVLAQPAFAVFLAIALLFWMAGYRKPPFAGRFSA